LISIAGRRKSKMMSAADAYSMASHYFQTGQVAAAEQLFRCLLDVEPGHAAALHALGQIVLRAGNVSEAVACFRRAAECQPGDADYWNDLGAACCVAKAFAEGAGACKRALRLRPDHAGAHRNLGYAFFCQEMYEPAVAALQEAIRLQPDMADAHGNLGVALKYLDRPAEAAAALEEAFRLDPTSAQVAHSAGMVHQLLGNTERALQLYRQALRLHPDFPDAMNNLATCCTEQDSLEEAQGQLEEALRLQPDYAEARHNLSIVLQQQGRVAEAIALLEQALRLQPDYAHAHYNLSLVLLLLGDLERGLPEYEWRWQTPDFISFPTEQPLWDGGPLDGKTILLHAEQGLGDTVQFIRYAPLVKERGATVLAACPPELLGVLRGCPGVDRWLLPEETLPAYDVHAPLLSLPLLCGTTLETIPAGVPYLAGDPGRVARFREQLAAVPGFKVGICWQGRLNHKNDRRRSVPLARFKPLANISGVRLIRLQRGPGSEQWDAIAGHWATMELSGLAQEPSEAWMDTAAIVSALDLVITVDTSVAHLAGALGVPVWVALPFCPDWRWLLDREDCPWYPTMRLFRQPRHGDWPAVFERIAAELQSNTAEKGHA
jgi:tetratricopeptide (TPR) repeat protein